MLVVWHARQQHGRSPTGQHSTDDVPQGGQDCLVLVATPAGGGPGDLSENLGGVLMFTSPAKPNKGSVDNTLKAYVFQMVTVVVDFANSYSFATIFTSMKGVWSSDTNVKRGRKGRDNCNGKDVSRA